jgi:uncharacterized protein YggE
MQKKFSGMMLLTVALAGLLVWNVLGGQLPLASSPALASQPSGTISVTGSSAIRVQPDRVVVVFGVETYAETPRASQGENARLSRLVLQAIQAHDVAEKDIATSHFSLQPEYDDFYWHRKVVGYWTRNTIAVTLHNVAKLEPVLITALEAGATFVDGVEFSVTNLRELRDQARGMAVQAAIEKAAAMADAAGMVLGDVTNIDENSWRYGYFGYWGSGRQWTNYQNVVQDLAAEGALMLEDGSISLGQIVVKAEVSLSAGLVPSGD